MVTLIKEKSKTGKKKISLNTELKGPMRNHKYYLPKYVQ